MKKESTCINLHLVQLADEPEVYHRTYPFASHHLRVTTTYDAVSSHECMLHNANVRS